MIINTKKRSTRYHSAKYHTSYGIQNWLCSKGYCQTEGAKWKVDKKQYKDLLKEFCFYDNPDFDTSKVKTLQTYENYVQKRFNKFCTFCGMKYKNNEDKES